MHSLVEIEQFIDKLARQINAPPNAMPSYNNLRRDGTPDIEVGESLYYYRALDRDTIRLNRQTDNIERLLYWVFADITSMMASEHVREHRDPQFSSRKERFEYQLILLDKINHEWKELREKEIEEVLKTTNAPSLHNSFVRTRYTWLGYTLLACFGFGLSLVGPIMPFLAAKLGLTFTQIGYHFTLMSVGLVFISLIGDRVAKWIGNDPMVWGAATLIGIVFLGITTGGSLAITLFSMFLYGCAIGAVFMIANTAIAIAAGAHAAKAYTEANIIAGIAMIMGPFLAGLVSRSVLGWQAIAFLPLIFVGTLKIFFWGLRLPVVQSRKDNSPKSVRHMDNRPLPLLFWVFGILMFLSVGIENLISALGASFFTTVVGLDLSTSAAIMSVFAVAIVLGRTIGRYFLGLMTESRLLILSLVWVLLTFPLYWLSTLPVLNVTGMFLVGLGVGNLAPLCVSGAMTAAGEASNRASARFGLFPPLSIFIMVQLFSILSDQYGIQRAYVFMIILVIVAITIVASTNRLRRVTA